MKVSQDWIKVITAMVSAAIVAWKLRKNREQLKGLHNELLEAKNDAAVTRADLNHKRRLNEPASVRRRNILIKAGTIAERLAEDAD